MDVDDNFATATQAFLDWLAKHHVTVSAKIELADLRSRDAGRGVLAKENIAEDEELFSIPRSSILTTETSSLPASIKEKLEDPWLSLIAAMVYEHFKGSNSTWKAYFDLLPESFDTLMFWSDDELRLLQGSAVTQKIGKQSADTAFEEQVIPALAPAMTGFSNEQILSLCHRMGSTIMAYAFDLESPTNTDKDQEDGWEEDEGDSAPSIKGMVPLADMLNADAHRNNAKLFYEEDKVVMKAITPIQTGDEIFNDFGPLPTADLLRRYGYVTNNYAVYDVVELSLQLIEETTKDETKISAESLSARIEYLEEQGLADDGFDVGHAGEDSPQFPEELCVLLNTLTATSDEFDKLKKKDKLPKPDLTTASQRLLHSILMRRGAAYAAWNAPPSGTPNSRSYMAAKVLQGEKQVLEEAADAVTTMLQDQSKKRKAETFDDDDVQAHRQRSTKLS